VLFAFLVKGILKRQGIDYETPVEEDTAALSPEGALDDKID
jgi:hypothetical protein